MKTIVWITLTCLGFANVVEQIDRYVFQVAPIPYIDYESYEYSLLAGTFFSVVYCIGVLIFALINDRIEMDRITIVAMATLVSSIALMFIPIVNNFWQLALLRLLMGVAQSPITTFCSSLIKDGFEEEWRGIAFGIFDSGTFFGFALSLVIGTVLYDQGGWKSPYIVFGLIGIVYSVIIRVVLTDPAKSSTTMYENCKQFTWGQSHTQTDESTHNALMEASSQSQVPGEGDNYNSTLRGNKLKETVYQDDNAANSNEVPIITQAGRTLRAVIDYCVEYPSIFIMCIGCGVRFAGGYQYAYYIALFFSDLYRDQEVNGSAVPCTYSYDSASGAVSDACEENYPYCIDSKCQKLNPTPWHNTGMSHDQFESAFAVSTVIGSVLGCMVGGYIGDWVSAHTSYGVSGRMIVGGASLFISAPMYVLMYEVSYPGCFVCLGVAGLFGEMYYGLALAVLAEMIPRKIFTVACALYISVLIGTGSNATLLVPLVTQTLTAKEHPSHTFDVSAAATAANYATNPVQEFQMTQNGSDSFQHALQWNVASCYIIGGTLFLISVPFVQADLRRIRVRQEGEARSGLSAGIQGDTANVLNSP